MSGESSRCSGFASGGVSRSRPKHRSATQVLSEQGEPVLLCGCERPVVSRTSRTERNPDRDFFQCATQGRKDVYFCNTWIWVDQVMDFVDQVVAFRSRPLREKLEITLADAAAKEAHIRQLQNQVGEMRSRFRKIKALRLIMLLWALCWFFIPNTAVVLGAISTLALMLLV